MHLLRRIIALTIKFNRDEFLIIWSALDAYAGTLEQTRPFHKTLAGRCDADLDGAIKYVQNLADKVAAEVPEFARASKAACEAASKSRQYGLSDTDAFEEARKFAPRGDVGK